ncbi:uncharacterized protein LOC114874408 isoform X1 [Osmia bicornis bicornis]|uniref:uncharacterized protein LOC114874408 isoform X1 n=2 Tax=Osmia bicornis bicornis TaxID=1437191 RepID=UPI0010FA3728|nr:uncharacterized protein LOC114874408 isoform X1 [Osmia bicornis bicornis]
MSLIIKYNESFYDVLWKYFMELAEITFVIFKLIGVVGFIVVISYILYHFHERRHTKFASESKEYFEKLQVIKNFNRSFTRCQSIISHKEMFNALEYAADKCSNKAYALKCIDIVVCCPQLLNIRSSVNGLTPFHRICFQGHTYLISFMLAKGADPFLTTITGENALCMAVYHFLNDPTKNDFSCLEILLQTGCEFGLKNKWYDILLKMAFNSNHIKLAQWLIRYHKTSSNKTLRCSSTPPVTKHYKFSM